LPDINKYNQVMQKLDPDGVQQVYMQRTSHSKMEEFRRAVKVNALKAAKEKAILLLESIGEAPGEVLFIREVPQNNGYPVYRTMANMKMEPASDGEAPATPMEKIQVRYEVEAHFSIK
jgi:uncharacterized protein YggE